MSAVVLRHTYADLAADLLAAGYPTIPIRPGAKAPAIDAWATVDITGAAVDAWAGDYSAHAVGLRLGPTAAGDNLAAIDLDILDDAVVKALAAVVRARTGGAQPLVRIGQAPKAALLIRTDVPTRKMYSRKYRDSAGRAHRVEILGEGQQVLLFGMHPSGKPYRWVGPSPLDVPADHLPALTLGELQDVLREFERMAGAAGWEDVAGSRDTLAAPDDFRGPVGADPAELREALQGIPSDDYTTWIDYGLALHHEFNGDVEGLDLWDEWSAKADNYPGRDELERKWAGFKIAGHGGTITVRSILYRAKEVERRRSAVLGWVDFASLAHESPPPREWVVDQWIPKGAVTALFGAGGVGKSLLAQQIAISIATGTPFMGVDVEAAPVVGVFAEDDAQELLRRAERILEAGMIDPADAARDLYLDARAGKENALAAYGPDHVGRPLPLARAIRTACGEIGPGVLILDNIAQMYAGPENSRAEVTHFCNILTGLARTFNMAVLLLGHPAKADGSEYSGSTAWDAAVRSRLFLSRNKDGSEVKLARVKSNYSAPDEMLLTFDHGVFRPLVAQDKDAAIGAAKDAIRDALATFTGRQVSTSHERRTRNYLPRLMAAEGVTGGHSMDVLGAALAAMIDAGEVLPNQDLGWKDASRHKVFGLQIAPMSKNEPGEVDNVEN